MIEKLKGILFPEKSNWQDLAVHTVGAKVVLVQVRVKINGAKQFRSVEVCEFMRPCDTIADFTTAILDGLKDVKPVAQDFTNEDIHKTPIEPIMHRPPYSRPFS